MYVSLPFFGPCSNRLEVALHTVEEEDTLLEYLILFLMVVRIGRMPRRVFETRLYLLYLCCLRIL